MQLPGKRRKLLK